MIDSIHWKLAKEQYKMKRYNHFDGFKTQQLRGFVGKIRYCKEYANKIKKKNIYFPMFEIENTQRGINNNPDELSMQISLGKLLHGSNAFEPDEKDLEKIYQKTILSLKNVGVETSKNELRQAVIKKADFSKIIILPTYLGKANEVIMKLAGFNYKPRSEFDFMQFKEGKGVFMRFGNSTQKYTIYDKIGEIFAKGYTKTENTIIKAVELGSTNRSLLKFELSYLRKDSFEKAMRNRLKIDKKTNFCLEDIFNLELSKDILLKSFDTVFESVAVGLISLSEMEENKLLAYLENSKLSQTKQRDLFYWVRMNTKNGIAGTWAEIKKKYKGSSVVRKKQEIALVLQELGQISGNTPNLIDFLRNGLERFEIIKPITDPHL